MKFSIWINTNIKNNKDEHNYISIWIFLDYDNKGYECNFKQKLSSSINYIDVKYWTNIYITYCKTNKITLKFVNDKIIIQI